MKPVVEMVRHIRPVCRHRDVRSTNVRRHLRVRRANWPRFLERCRSSWPART
jgi:hypothetical protein